MLYLFLYSCCTLIVFVVAFLVVFVIVFMLYSFCTHVVLTFHSCSTHYWFIFVPSHITHNTYPPSVKNHMECKSAANAKRFTRLSVALGTPWKEARNSTKTSNAEDGRFVRDCIVRGLILCCVIVVKVIISLCVHFIR